MDPIFLHGFADELEKIAISDRAKKYIGGGAALGGAWTGAGGHLPSALVGAAVGGTVGGATHLLTKQKKASTAAELAGLGILAAPSAYHLATGKEFKEKNKSKTEIAGLGTLAYGALKGALTKKAADLWNPTTGETSEAVTHVRGSIKAKELAGQKPAINPASKIHGTPYHGPNPKKPIGFANPSTGPRMAALGKVTANAPKEVGLGSKLMGAAKKLFR